MHAPRLLALGLLALAPLAATRGAQEPQVAEAALEPVDFAREVRPILTEHCFACHGPDAAAREAGLSLVSLEEATRVRGGAAAIVPGDLDASELWWRVSDEADPMPPVDAHRPLSDAQKDTLRRWIEQGASYAEHWAYVTPRASEAPGVIDQAWPRDAVDHHILARLEREGLDPAPDADRVTLARRLAFDLTGLPVSAERLAALLADEAPDAVARYVDELLASPHHAERLAVWWLDLVRYADTVGYHGDQEHHIWPYRDQVIEAFHANQPFDDFTIEQLAGDLLPAPTQAQLVASGYNRLLQTTHEGGLQLKEYRAIYMADRVRNVSQVWMGATVGCAQCHDHKFDPYTARDFHTLGAFFADVDDEEHLRDPYGGLNTTPTKRVPEMRVLSEADAARRRELALEHDHWTGRHFAVARDLDDRRPAWEAALRERIAAAQPVEHLWVDDELATGGRSSGAWNFVRREDVAPHSGERYREQSSAGRVQHYTVDTTDVQLTVAEGDVLFAWVYLPAATPPEAVMLQFHSGGWEHRAVWGSDAIDYGRRDASWDGYRRMGGLPARDAWVRLEVPAADVGLGVGAVVDGLAFTQFGGTVLWDEAGLVTEQAAPPEVVAALALEAADRTDAQRQALEAHHAATDPQLVTSRAEGAAIEAEQAAFEAALPKTMVTRALDEPRVVRVLPRGDWLDESGEVVEPEIPAFLGALATPGRATRLDLARWLVTPAAEGGVGELTARVLVNRLWMLLFGEGLCPSPEDFGGQGRPPTHPELLDQLALDLVAGGWDLRALLRRLVLTRTYAQSSVPGAAVLARDPDNLLFARQGRWRLEAEFVRDVALSLSGLLVDERGGPSVKPPQPAGLYRHLNFPVRRYHPDRDARQWRRGVYVHRQRQFVHPTLAAFDAPTREECTVRRPTSNTPLAALASLNDPSAVEAARAFAARLLEAQLAADAPRVARAFRAATGRGPGADEAAILLEVLQAARLEFARDPGAAAALIAVGDAPRGTDAGDVELAAWTQVTRVILNLHEVTTRE